MRWPVVDIVGLDFSLEKTCFVFVDVGFNDTWKESESDLVTERL